MALYHTQRRVSFSDTDLAGIVHFSRSLTYVEDAEHAWLETLGHNLEGELAWPRVHVNCDYLKPLRFRDQVDVFIPSVEVGASSLSYCFELRVDGEIAAKGSMTLVRIFQGGGKAPFSQEERLAFTNGG